MRLCRFAYPEGGPKIGCVLEENALIDLSSAGIDRLEPLLESEDCLARMGELTRKPLPRVDLSKIRLLAPVERQEVWAAGVTYLRSKKARMDESEFSANAYDRVYDAERPELFFKSLGEKVVATGEPVGIRSDARWSVPEPELALVLNSRGNLVGYTIGNDMSSRDIEGENLLYLPQAKVYQGSCALGPWIQLDASEATAREWKIQVTIHRKGAPGFAGETSVSQIKRSFAELAGYLFRSQQFAHGAVLLTGTGVVPPDHFTLQPEDLVEIQINGIGWLRNPVITV
jgi:2-dehydro-3-deoxy-D-arabinonate dehydratase